MRVVKGELKLQYGLLQIYEMIEFRSASQNYVSGIAGYSIFNLDNQKLGHFRKNFKEIMTEAERLSENTHAADFLIAA